jgi:hypothetical protein
MAPVVIAEPVPHLGMGVRIAPATLEVNAYAGGRVQPKVLLALDFPQALSVINDEPAVARLPDAAPYRSQGNGATASKRVFSAGRSVR